MGSRPSYPVDVKVPQLYVDIIDENLKDGRALYKTGFTSRAQFVKEAVREKLMGMGLLSEEDQKKLEAASRQR